jgi:uncharacterized membrane protein YbhN (UPF0104 family)
MYGLILPCPAEDVKMVKDRQRATASFLFPFVVELRDCHRNWHMTKNHISSLLKIAISIVLLGAVFAHTGWQRVVPVLATAQPGWLILALVVYVLGVGVRAVRWSMLLRGLGVTTQSVWRLTALFFVSFFFNSFLPTGIGGDVVRIAEVARTTGTPAAASSVVADRAVGLVATSLLALVALPLAGARVNPILAWIAGVAVVGPIVLFWILRWGGARGLAAVGGALPFLRPLVCHPKVRQTTETLTAYALSDLTRALIVSLAFSGTNVLTYACIGEAVHVDLPLTLYMLVSPIITLVLLVPVSFNGLGTRDVAYQALLVPVGVASAGALAMSLTYHALNLLTAVVGGGVYALMGATETLATGEDKVP